MRKAVVIITLFLCSVTPCDAASEKSVVKLDFNWPAFMAHSFHNLRAQGAFLVSAVRKSKQTQFIRIKSLAGETCRIMCDLKDEIKLACSKTAHFTLHDGLIELNLEKGEEVALYTGEKTKSFVVTALPMKPDLMNGWGERELKMKELKN